MSRDTCVYCGTVMRPVIDTNTTHPHCELAFTELDGEDPFSSRLRAKLMDTIRWADDNSPRSQQVAIGPSELGTACDRRLGYRIAEVPPVNNAFDPWAAIVGTAVHAWLEQAMQAWMVAHKSEEWVTERTLLIDEMIEGHSDLYWHEQQAVIDYKTAGPDVMKKIRKDGTPESHQIQTHVYGYGFEKAGLPVKRVCLVFLPRSGWLKDMIIWHADYRRDVAIGAIYRLYDLATQITELDILKDGNSYRWEQIPAFPSNDCGFCPWYQPGRDLERGADHMGCPGR